MNDPEELKERAARLERLHSNVDFLKTLDEIDEMMGLSQNVFSIFKAQQTGEFVIAREGCRAYSMKLRRYFEDTKLALKQAADKANTTNGEY